MALKPRKKHKQQEHRLDKHLTHKERQRQAELRRLITDDIKLYSS
jgi:hypothetical protein